MSAMPPYLRFVLGCTYVPTDQLVALARHAEFCGFDVLSLSDHLVFPEEPRSAHPYSRTGQLPFDHDDPWSEPWVTIGAMSAVTTQLRFMTNVYVLPLRDPFSVAKAVGTAAVLSGDRVSLGIGVGWMRDEFDLVGRSFTTRGARTNEMIPVLRSLWSPGPSDFTGQFYSFEGLHMSPTPARQIPILVGGESEAARDRAARLGDGFVSTPHRAATLVDLVGDLEDRRRRFGRLDHPFDVVAVATDLASAADHAGLAERGVTGLVVVPWGHRKGRADSLDEKMSAMSRFAEQVIRPVRDAGVAAAPTISQAGA